MNYKLEEEFDFYSELNKEDDNIIDDNVKKCMISHMPLTYNSITLSCGHTFNYMPLYNDLSLKNFTSDIVKCPYCRCRPDKLMFYLPLPNVKKIYGINFPSSSCMPYPKCNYKLKLGINKGLFCNKNGIEDENGVLCKKHTQLNISCKPEKNIIWTPEKEKIFTTMSVNDIKVILKERGLKLNGLKKDLVNRLVINN